MTERAVRSGRRRPERALDRLRRTVPGVEKLRRGLAYVGGSPDFDERTGVRRGAGTDDERRNHVERE